MAGADARPWLILALLVAGGWLVYLLAPVLTPFLTAALLAYLGDPLVDRLEGWRLPRTAAVLLVFLILVLAGILALLVLVPALETQVRYLVQRVPDYLQWLRETAVPWLAARLGLTPADLGPGDLLGRAGAGLGEAGSLAAAVLASLSASGARLLGWLANLLLVPVVTFYLLRDWDVLVARIHSLVPRRVAPTVARLARESDQVLGAFLRGQFLVMLALAAVYALGLVLAGLRLGLLIGVVAGLVSFVPYLGLILGLALAGVAALVQTHELAMLGWVALVFGIGQVLESAVLTPLLVGDRIGLHPVAVIFAVLAGGQLFGLPGVLLALPVAAVVAVLVRHAHQRYLASGMYGRDGPG